MCNLPKMAMIVLRERSTKTELGLQLAIVYKNVLCIENNEFLIKYGDDKENILTFAWIFCLVI